MRKTALATLVLSLSLGAHALGDLHPTAHAGGFEVSGVGTRGMGRGGAFAARVDDSLALALNPAMLADADAQILLNASLTVWDACVTRSGNYAPDGALPGDTYAGGGSIFGPDDGNLNPSTWADQAFPRVCNGGAPQIAPQIMANVRLTDELGMGFGIVAPNGTGTARWGNSDGTVMVNGQRLPTPVRYMVTEQDLLLFFPSVGIGYRPFDWLRIGLTLQWGIGIINFTNYTNSGTAAQPGAASAGFEDPSADIRTRLSVIDPFVPAGIFSVHLIPHENFEIMVSGRISDSIGGVADAQGHLELQTGTFGTGADGSYVPTVSRIENVRLSAGQPFQFTLAMRYADRIRSRSYHRTVEEALAGQVDDAMRNENFDIELDVVFEQLSQVTDFVVNMPAGSMGQLTTGGPGGSTMGVPIPAPLPIPHGWSDVLTLRLGSDVNAIPGTLAVRAGVSFELPLDNRYRNYIQNDFISGWRLGLHAGGTVRIERFDISLAYGFFLGETVNVTPADARFRQINALQMEGVCPATGATYNAASPVTATNCYPGGFGGVVNAGRYEQMHHIVSLGASYHF
ncbi:MAG: hypothetical protein J0L92_33315 [Deltaproteobacteria bacterium]|nr:hypothetical protein [Deltaproteobacteria bacterium]